MEKERVEGGSSVTFSFLW